MLNSFSPYVSTTLFIYPSILQSTFCSFLSLNRMRDWSSHWLRHFPKYWWRLPHGTVCGALAWGPQTKTLTAGWPGGDGTSWAICWQTFAMRSWRRKASSVSSLGFDVRDMILCKSDITCVKSFFGFFFLVLVLYYVHVDS